ncbi:MAG: bifunctional oligoribonuclease/PAP phosphatase NrnA [Clostridia bacterium]|nr:bifunctional oligoribonuclease/PAP phosphatase NrnA [Clostridia bacterium]
MRITKSEAAEILLAMDNILILAHENPDGDAVGSTCALCKGLRSIGKNAAVSLEKFSKNDEKLAEGLIATADFNYDHIIAVDTADNRIMGVGETSLNKNCEVELCIDHHISNIFYAKNTCLDEKAAAAGEVVYDILKEMNIEITKDIAECIYVAVATDTGCFRYSNTTAKTFRTAADMADLGADVAAINKIQFETKSKEYAAIEKMAISSMQLHFDGKCAILAITNEMYVESNVSDSETQPLASLPRQIEGVYAGITVKEKKKGMCRISVRTNAPVNASKIASYLGGGGHSMAAGCSFEGSVEDAVKTVLAYTEKELKESGLI